VPTEDYSWELKDYQEKKMDIKFTFTDPLNISSKEKDKVRVTFIDSPLIFDLFGQELEGGSFMEKQISP